MALFKRKPTRSAFEEEALPHMSALYGAALRLTHSPGDAEDLVQDAMLRAYRFFDSFQPGTNCKAWLFRILTNVFRNKYREREREQEIMNEAESSTANLGQFTTATVENTESALLGRMVSREVEEALSAVPAEFRLAVILADLEDFSYKEIADIMDCPAGTVMSRLYRGRKLLQKQLVDYAIEQGIVSPESEAAQAVKAEALGAKEHTASPKSTGPADAKSEGPAAQPHSRETLDLDAYRKTKTRNRNGGAS
ncbi:MAG: sigma-70 family RNA polymerase sigma factor [Myxococcales bacterium]|nr:sigma-70 family RNA polymerase sigma factor [Myxococcales bacterium]